MDKKNSQDLPFCNSCSDDGTLPKVVVARGNPRARFMVIGEAPGATEDQLGEPFVGKSGKMLDRLLDGVGINPQMDVYVCNLVKCRPPKNRRPTKLEIFAASPWLHQQIVLVDPLVIALLGATAVQRFLGAKDPISKIRGNWHSWDGRFVMPLFHPSYLLRNPSMAKGSPISLTQEDLLEISNRLNMYGNGIDMSALECAEMPSNP